MDWSVIEIGEPGFATLDDVDTASGTLVFEPGETTQRITISVRGDTNVEGDEIVLVLLGNPSNNIRIDLTGFGAVAAATIVDDDIMDDFTDDKVMEWMLEYGGDGDGPDLHSTQARARALHPL